MTERIGFMSREERAATFIEFNPSFIQKQLVRLYLHVLPPLSD